jgi:hypothetical protein
LQELRGITGVSVKALQGSLLGQLSVDEHMSSVGERKKKRKEDAAYSLLGIFDVYILLIYGDGWEKALAWLQKGINATSNEGWSCLLQEETS